MLDSNILRSKFKIPSIEDQNDDLDYVISCLEESNIKIDEVFKATKNTDAGVSIMNNTFVIQIAHYCTPRIHLYKSVNPEADEIKSFSYVDDMINFLKL